MYKDVGEKLKVLAIFDNGQVSPKILRWGKRKLLIKKVNLEYQEREGRSINYYFAVETDKDDVLKIKYNNENLAWTIEEVWEE
jgi:hypothetical protein